MKKIIYVCALAVSLFAFVSCGEKGVCALCGESAGEKTVYEVKDELLKTEKTIKLCDVHKKEYEESVKAIKDFGNGLEETANKAASELKGLIK